MVSPPHVAPNALAVDWYRFLARPRLPSPSAETIDQLREASILVTGAGGSIGCALSLKLAALRPRRLVLLDASEQALYRLQSRLNNSSTVTTILGSLTDETLLEEILSTHKPTLIFHAAAHKHIALLEEHPLAAIANNALGTHTLATLAQRHSVPRVVLLSTDKAVEPTSILGATKRIAEQVVLTHGGIVLRLCNVLGTEGSVVDTFVQQIAAGEALTLAHAEADRYFITLEEAVDLLFSAAVASPPASLLIPQLQQPHRITALANYLMATCSTPEPSPLKYVGLRPGDKLHEKLWSDKEVTIDSRVPGCLEIQQTLHEHKQFTYPVLGLQMTSLQTASNERDLARALELVMQLVPDYTPGQKVLSMAKHIRSGVPHP